MADADTSDLAVTKRRSKRAWEQRAPWDRIYNEAYDYLLPHRRPASMFKSKAIYDRIFDMTGPNSAQHFAGELQQQVFSGEWIIEASDLVKAAQGEEAAKRINDEAEKMSRLMSPFIRTDSLENATLEMCSDLVIGTGAVIPMKGPSIEEPIIHVCIPQDQIAPGVDAWGRVNYLSWKRDNVTREQVKNAWPRGKFHPDFVKAEKAKPDQEIVLYQDFYKLPDGRWKFCVYLDKDCPQFIDEAYTRNQPVALTRWNPIAGNALGIGVGLVSLPTVKTSNKAQEMALKSMAISMLGIWGYRAGGTVNADTFRVGAGEFWPMLSTGGVLGPDVQRLDTANGRIDVSRMLIGNLQQMIRDALLDARIVDDGGTPPSASEITARMQQNARKAIGAKSRMVREFVPVIAARSLEILNEWQLIPNRYSANGLLSKISVRSPLKMAENAMKLEGMLGYRNLVLETAGPQRLEEFINLAALFGHARDTLQVSHDVVPSNDEQKAAQAAMQSQELASVAGQMGIKAAPQLVQAATEAQAA